MSLEDRTDLVYSKNRGWGLMDISFFINVQRFVACHQYLIGFRFRNAVNTKEMKPNLSGLLENITLSITPIRPIVRVGDQLEGI